MRLTVFTKNLSGLSCGFGMIASVCVAAPAPAFAQAQPPDAASQAEGHIIYSRHVAYGSAIGPRTPGQAQSVNAGPTVLIVSSLATGLEPISDDESAGILAGTNAQVGSIGGQIAFGMGALVGLTGANGSPDNIGNVQNAATGGAINQATGAINGAMGTLRGALNGGLNGGRNSGPGGGQ